jgi:hypothetical protein
MTSAYEPPAPFRINPGSPAPEPPISPEQCVAAGGHCPESTGAVYAVLNLSSSSTYEVRCRHCGLTGSATPRSGIDYSWGS